MAKKAGRPRKLAAEPQVTNSAVGDGETVVIEPPKRGRGRPRQQVLNDDPAFESIREIEVVANDYVSARDQRQAMLADEVNFKKRLIEVMKKYDLTNYSYDGYMVEVDHVDEDVVKVKKRRAAKEDASLA